MVRLSGVAMIGEWEGSPPYGECVHRRITWYWARLGPVEITAIPKLLSILELKGCIITIDAMGCQKEIARQIIDGGSDYILAVKSNQGELNHNVRDAFSARSAMDSMEWLTAQVNKDHGRLETTG